MQEPSRLHLPTVGQLLMGGLGSLFFLCAGGSLLLFGLLSLAQSPVSASPFFSLTWVSILFFVLVLPSIILAARRLMGKAQPGWTFPFKYRVAVIMMVTWVPLVFFGTLVSGQSNISYAVLPPLQILVVGIPIWFFLETGFRKLPNISFQRGWGVLDFSLLVTMPFILFVELAFFLALGLAGMNWLTDQQGIMNSLNQIGMRLANSNFNPDVIERILRQYLQQPVVIIIILSLGAGVTPLIEELLKPLGIWFFWRKRITPLQGYQLGLLSGCAFALIESLGSVSTNLGNGWMQIVVGRVGTGLLHMLTTALVGWGMALAWQNGKYFRLALAFFAAFCLHSLWNIFSLLMGTFPYLSEQNQFYRIGQIAPAALLLLVLIMVIILIKAPQFLGKVIEDNQMCGDSQTETGQAARIG